MKFSVGVDYSLKALLMLTERYSSATPLRVEEIAAAQEVPENYLRRLLVELRRAGLVVSQKGPNGGYMLARSPSRITMADVVQAVEGDYTPVECLKKNGSGLCRREDPCPMREVWRGIQESVNAALRAATLEKLWERRRGALMYSI